MALTLLEASKLNSGEVLNNTVIKIFAESSELMAALPFTDIPGDSYKYNQEETLPGVGFRGINEAYSESTGILNPVIEPLVIAGGDLDVDKMLIKTRGPETRASQEAMKIKALSLKITEQLIKGDSTSDPRGFDGLQTRLLVTGTQVIWNHATTGVALVISNLDQLVDQVRSPTHLVMNKTMRRIPTQATRDTSVGGQINYVQNEFGRQQTFYAEFPILIIDENNLGDQILKFDEVGQVGGTLNTSIYCVSFGADSFEGLQNGGIEATDLGEIDDKPVMRTRVEWLVGLSLTQPKGAARLGGILNAAATA